MFKTLKNILLDLLFPRRCIGCRQADTWLCSSCCSLIQPSRTQCCYICRKPNPEAKTCDHHVSSRTLNRLFVAAHYSGNPILKKAIHSLKYERHPEDIAEKLSLFLLKTIKKELPTAPNGGPFGANSELLTILPIPLHADRLKKRGFNQAELLSKSFEQYHEHRIHRTLVQRVRSTASQVENKTREKRLENLKGAFTITEPIDPNTTYLLIDDVTTTGSTLEECCEALRKAGAKQVWGMVLARN